MELTIGNKKVELKDIVNFYGPVFNIAFSADEESQGYISTTLACLEFNYVSYEDLNETIFALLEHNLFEIEKWEQFKETLNNLKLIYTCLLEASETLKDFIKYKSPENVEVYNELEIIKNTLNTTNDKSAGNLLEQIIIVYKEDTIEDFTSYQVQLYENVLKEDDYLRKDMQNLFGD